MNCFRWKWPSKSVTSCVQCTERSLSKEILSETSSRSIFSSDFQRKKRWFHWIFVRNLSSLNPYLVLHLQEEILVRSKSLSSSSSSSSFHTNLLSNQIEQCNSLLLGSSRYFSSSFSNDRLDDDGEGLIISSRNLRLIFFSTQKKRFCWSIEWNLVETTSSTIYQCSSFE